MVTLLTLISQIRKLKSEHQLSLQTELATLTIVNIDKKMRETIRKHEELIKGITHAHTIAYGQADQTPKLAQEAECGMARISFGAERVNEYMITIHQKPSVFNWILKKFKRRSKKFLDPWI